jgi:hypothetical protein
MSRFDSDDWGEDPSQAEMDKASAFLEEQAILAEEIQTSDELDAEFVSDVAMVLDYHAWDDTTKLRAIDALRRGREERNG